MILPKTSTILSVLYRRSQDCETDGTYSARLFLPNSTATDIPLNLTLFNRSEGGQIGDQVATSGPYSDTVSGVRIPRLKLEAGVYVLVPSAWGAGMGVGKKWELRVWAEGPVEVELAR